MGKGALRRYFFTAGHASNERSQMKHIVCSAIALSLSASTSLHAQEPTPPAPTVIVALNELKAKIFDAKLTTQTFAAGAKFCKELDGTTTFYFTARNRILNLAEYHRSLDNLAREGVFNAETRRPWNAQDASARWDEAQKEAVKDKANCDLIASLPFLEKKLQELQGKTQASDQKN
jgi:hypothetical protein